MDMGKHRSIYRSSDRYGSTRSILFWPFLLLFHHRKPRGNTACYDNNLWFYHCHHPNNLLCSMLCSLLWIGNYSTNDEQIHNVHKQFTICFYREYQYRIQTGNSLLLNINDNDIRHKQTEVQEIDCLFMI